MSTRLLRTESGSTAIAALFYAGVVGIYLWPALSGQKVLVPTDLLYRNVPWYVLAPPDLAEFTNLTLTDPVQQLYPWMHLAANAVQSGDLPGWNPYVFAGSPFVANPQVALFGPFSVPFWIFPLPYAFGLAAACKLWVAALGMFLFARQLGCGRWAALFAGCAFGLSPFLVVWLSNPVSSVFAWLPACLFFLDHVLASGGTASMIGLALSVGALNLSGHPGSQLHCGLAIGLYGGVRAGLAIAANGWAAARRLGTVAVGIVLAVMLSAVEWLPFLYVLPDSNGLSVRAGGGGILPVDALIGAVVPDWWDIPRAAFCRAGR